MDLAQVEAQLARGEDDVGWGPNNTFRFPAEGGTGAIWTTLAAALPRLALLLGLAGLAFLPFEAHFRPFSLSGRPTVLGWYVHEWLWRGDRPAVDWRRREVRRFYETRSAADAQAFLRRYGVSYVALGKIERQEYPQLRPEVLRALGPVVFAAGKVAIIAVAPGRAP